MAGQIKGLTVDQIEEIAASGKANWIFLQSIIFELCQRVREQEKQLNKQQKQAA